jgi:hypothetical protein
MTPLQILGIIASLTIFVIVVKMIRGRKLQDEYSSIWIFIALALFLGSVFSRFIIGLITRILGTEVTMLYFVVIFVLLFLVLVSVKLSVQKAQITNLFQENALLGERITSLEAKLRRK